MWRVNLFDPDRIFTRLEPMLRGVWTRRFLFLSLAVIAAAGVILWLGRRELATPLPAALSWKTVALA